MRTLKFLLIICAVLFSSVVFSANAISIEKNKPGIQNISPQTPAKANVVLFGVYPLSITDLNLAKSTFRINFYAWWRTKDKNYQPTKTVEIVNAEEYYTKGMQTGKNGDEYFTNTRYFAVIHKNFDIKYFPFDRQFLKVSLEDFQYGIENIVFEPDREQSKLHPGIAIEDWNIIGLSLISTISEYPTNFGDASTPKSQFSRLTFIIEIKRQGLRPYFNYFVGFFIAAFLACIMHFIKVGRKSARAALVVGAIFSWVGNKYLIDHVLPFNSVFSLSDMIQIATFLIIIFSISTYVFIDFVTASIPLRKNLNFWSGGLSFLIYCVFIGIYTYIAVIS